MYWMGKSENLYSQNRGLICSWNLIVRAVFSADFLADFGIVAFSDSHAGFGGRDSEVKSGTTHLKVIRTWKG